MENLNTIETNIEMLNSFAFDLNAFFERRKSKHLFKKMPLKDEKKTALLRLAEGRYMLRPCGIEIIRDECNHIAIDLLELLKTHLANRKEDITAVVDAFMKEKISAHDIILNTFRNEGHELRKKIKRYNLPEDLFTFFAIYLTRPFREQAAFYLMEGIEKLDWFCGYCPVCGHWPSLGHIRAEEGNRTLWCLCCNTRWNFKRIQCAFCLNENHKSIKILNPKNEESYRIQVCNKCKRYLKEIRSNGDVKTFPFDKVYLGTLPLDIIANKKGYIQESILTVRYEDSDGKELLLYRQQKLS